MATRRSAVAGAFYPGKKEDLSDALNACFSNKEFGPGGANEKADSLIGGLVPHAGFAYSGPCAAKFYSLVPVERIRTVVLLGPNHTGLGAPVSISPSDNWETPLGKVPVDGALRERLSDSSKIFRVEAGAHVQEHSLEVQLPFLQRVFGDADFSVLPLIIWEDSLETCRAVGEALAKSVARKRTLIIASSDLNHYAPQGETIVMDKLAIDSLLSLSPERLYETVKRNRISMCGILPATAALFAMEALGAGKARLLGHYTSGDISGESSRGVVGYASVAFS